MPEVKVVLFDYALRCEERILRESFVTNDRIVPTVINKGQSISTTRHNKRQILQRIIASINSVQTDWIVAILRYRQIAAKIDGYEKNCLCGIEGVLRVEYFRPCSSVPCG